MNVNETDIVQGGSTLSRLWYQATGRSWEAHAEGGPVAQFDTKFGTELNGLKVKISPMQEGTGDPSPTNIRPITGWTNVNIYLEESYDETATPTVTIALGQTVYGGTLDVVNGMLTVDSAINVLDGTQELSKNGTHAYGGIEVRYIPSPTKAPAPSVSAQNYGLLSDRFNTSVSDTINKECAVTGRATNANAYFNMPATVTTVDEAKAWFTDNPTQLLYKLAEPITVQLDPTTITALTGHNTIWCNTGDIISVDYNII